MPASKDIYAALHLVALPLADCQEKVRRTLEASLEVKATAVITEADGIESERSSEKKQTKSEIPEADTLKGKGGSKAGRSEL